jgi:hypothetical protein
MLRERALSLLYQLVLFLVAIWGAFLILTFVGFPLGPMIYNGREMYVLMGFILFLLLYFIAPRLTNGKKIFPDEVKPSLASYLLVFLIFSSGLWLRSIVLELFLWGFYFLTLIRGIGISKIEYPNRLKQHYSAMRLCLTLSLSCSVPCVALFLLGPGYVGCLPKYFCLAHDLLALTLIILYFIVSSLEIKRKRDPWPFL